jgi:cell division protein FtsA
MKLGVMLIEFGGGCTSVSIYSGGQIVYTDGVPLGGINITNDIARGLYTDFYNAERTKTLYSTVVCTDADAKGTVEVPLSNDEDSETSTVTRSVLADITRARVEEILELLICRLQEAGHEPFNNKLVITGCGANLNGLKELVSHIFSAKVRGGYARAVSGVQIGGRDLGFVTGIGMLYYVAQAAGGSIAPRSDVNKIWQWFKNNFV